MDEDAEDVGSARTRLDNHLAVKQQRPPEGGLHDARSINPGLVANHPAAAIRKTDPMPSHATARSCTRCHDHGSGDDNDSAIRAASAIGPAMKAGATAARDLDRHAGRSLARCKRHGLHGASRQSQNESKSDKPVHSFSPCIAIAPPIMNRAASGRKGRIRRFPRCLPRRPIARIAHEIAAPRRQPNGLIPALIAHRDCHIGVAIAGHERFLHGAHMGVSWSCRCVAVMLRRRNRGRTDGGHAAMAGRRAFECAAPAWHAAIRCLDGGAGPGSGEAQDG